MDLVPYGRTPRPAGTIAVLLAFAGTAHRDVIAALGGNDDIEGRGGNDLICGGSGNDELEDDRGDDRLYCGTGYDEAEGGAGHDLCVAEERKGS